MLKKIPACHLGKTNFKLFQQTGFFLFKQFIDGTLHLLFNHYSQRFSFFLFDVFKFVVTKQSFILVQIRNNLTYLIDIDETINGIKD